MAANPSPNAKAQGKEKEKSQDNSPKKVYYIGEDASYFADISNRFKTIYETIKFEFKLFPYKDIDTPELLHKLYLEILLDPPSIIYIDYTIKESEMLYLANLLAHETLCEHTAIIGLLDYLCPETLREEVVLMGIKICHFKSSERSDVVFDAMYLQDIAKVKDPGVCIAKLSDPAQLAQVCRLRAITENRADIEGDFAFSPGEEINMKTSLSGEIIPSLNYIVKDVFKINLLYDYQAYFSMGHLLVDQVPSPEKGDKLTRKERLLQSIAFEERESKLNLVKKKLKAWIQAEYNPSYIEKLKVLLIDRNLYFFQQLNTRADYLNYDIRAKTRNNNSEKDIFIYRPHFIFFNYEYVEIEEQIKKEESADENTENNEVVAEEDHDFDESESEVGEAMLTIRKLPSNPDEAKKAVGQVDEITAQAINGEFALNEIMKSILSNSDYKPFVVIFNCLHESTASLQTKYKYNQMIAYPTIFNLKAASGIIEIYDKKRKVQKDKEVKAAKEAAKLQAEKLAASLAEANESGDKKSIATATAASGVGIDLSNAKVIIHPTDLRRSVAEVLHSVTIEAASESHVMIRSRYELPYFSVHRLEIQELKMHVTIVPNNDKSKDVSNKGMFKGLVHSIGEKDKSELRRFVNSVFFRKQDKEREAELEQFKNLNSKARQTKQLQQKQIEESKRRFDAEQKAKKEQIEKMGKTAAPGNTAKPASNTAVKTAPTKTVAPTTPAPAGATAPKPATPPATGNTQNQKTVTPSVPDQDKKKAA